MKKGKYLIFIFIFVFGLLTISSCSRGALATAGIQGEAGDVGAQGPKGDKGDTGAQGPKGEKGDKGDTGETGPMGPTGPQGETGKTGPTGPQGEKGSDGTNGSDGHSPEITIGENGNWFIDGVDTGKSSRGETGLDGRGILSAYIDDNGSLILSLTDGSTIDVGVINPTVHSYGDYEFSLRSDSTYQVAGYNGLETAIVIPNEYNDKPVTSISESLFEGNTQIVSVTIPDSIKLIGAKAFKGCTSLSSISLKSTSELSSIGSYAFQNCNHLTAVYISSSVKSIGKGAFQGSGLTSATFASTNSWNLTAYNDGYYHFCPVTASKAANALKASYSFSVSSKQFTVNWYNQEWIFSSEYAKGTMVSYYDVNL